MIPNNPVSSDVFSENLVDLNPLNYFIVHKLWQLLLYMKQDLVTDANFVSLNKSDILK